LELETAQAPLNRKIERDNRL